MTDKAVVLLSGGIDSATSLFLAKKKGWRLYALTFDYEQGSKVEPLASARIAQVAEVDEHYIVKLPFFKQIRDLQERASPRLVEPVSSSGRRISPAYVSARDTIFYGIAAAYAEVLGAQWIVFGSNAEDSLELPDATPEYIERMNEALERGTSSPTTGRPIRIFNPLIRTAKLDVLKLALELGVTLELTWSCHEDSPLPCGKCRGCESRQRVFDKLGLRDPAQVKPS